MRALVVVALGSLVVACGSSSSNKCVPGASVACTCANGQSGAQLCASDGTLGTCTCEMGTGTGGSATGGTPGTGGTHATGGTLGTGGVVATGGVTGTGGTVGTGGTTTTMSASGQFTVTYDGTITKTYFSGCYLCQANFYPTLQNEGALAMSYNGGRSTVSVDARNAKSGGGDELWIGVGDNDPSLPAGVQGDYGFGPGWVPMAGSPGSCATFTQYSLQRGGTLAGTLNCTLTGGSDTTPHTAVVQGSFQGTFAP
jgi:hypothetical protein